ncbi:ABC transporter ATP-binding protein [Spongiactinospora sp. TRM90649]|uniref:ABC transporter ATP-binding protein n=1 Tax=Spongiactinospora sp. TRM90649 TaxID=3031114 RepID=UPI0023F8C39F|nr:ABC transporter ATP-binding protein [Spongiactinospora sp. TRM90649]MDF5758961.1 ABC transporter ATP-binding protein [Spongiactinospora sp. TRM90649]
MTEDILAVSGISVTRGDVPVIHDVTIGVQPDAVTVLLGANGAGKTTLLDGIAGLAKTTAGSITLAGTALSGLPTYRRTKAGLGYAEQSRTVFKTLTVEQNLLVADNGSGDLGTAYRLFPELERRRTLGAGHLSGGEQQMLVLARALISGPKVLLIDEMSLGLAPVVVRRLMTAVGELTSLGIAILLVEQFANLALEIGARAYVLRKGQVVFEGPCADLLGDEDLLHEHYFGGVEAPADDDDTAGDKAMVEGEAR